jgi:hypothetical protein
MARKRMKNTIFWSVKPAPQIFAGIRLWKIGFAPGVEEGAG